MTQEIVIRQYADGTYGVGETVIPGVTLFRAGNHGLTQEEADKEFKRQRSGKKQ